ncbi:MAG TPA: hypothetical protein VFR09_02395 [Alphaproteobacteria bacterium]|nr:hypothetical protein [Alphaproteobacteria bacterium]
MFRIQWAIAVLAVILMAAPGAYAFSTEKSSDAFKGDSSSFTDPDEKMPAFVTSPDNQSSLQQPSRPSENVDEAARREQYMGLTQGFDRAYQQK